MARTSEQVKADDNLEEAIKACRMAYLTDEDDNTDGVMVNYLVLYAVRYWDDDGDPMTAQGTQVSWPPMSIAEQMGVCEYQQTKLRSFITKGCTCDGHD